MVEAMVQHLVSELSTGQRRFEVSRGGDRNVAYFSRFCWWTALRRAKPGVLATILALAAVTRNVAMYVFLCVCVRIRARRPVFRT